MSPKAFFAGACLALLLQAPAGAQQPTRSSPPADGRIIGVVVDEQTRQPIPGALVFLSDGRFTETDSAGQFSFSHVRAGSHEIAAVTDGCALVRGGFEIRSGEAKLLEIHVELPDDPEGRGRGTAHRVIEGQEVVRLGLSSALAAIDHLASNLFQVSGNRVLLRARGGSAHRMQEPLLVVNGQSAEGYVALLLSSIPANDIGRIEIHLGNAAGWRYRPGGAPAVIEVFTRSSGATDGHRKAESCVDWNSR